MIPSMQKYLNLSKILIQRRDSGDVTEDEEEDLLSQLDELWYEMTREEHDRVEKILNAEETT